MFVKFFLLLPANGVGRLFPVMWFSGNGGWIHFILIPASDRSGTYMDGFSAVQRGEVGDITAGFSLGPWTEDVAQRLMAQNEIYWDAAGLHGLGMPLRRGASRFY
jgi:hypothetical protein